MPFVRPTPTAHRARLGRRARALAGASTLALAWGVWASPAGAQALCVGTLGASSAQAPAAGGTATVGLTIGVGCMWTSTSNAPWITNVSTSGLGTGTVSYTVAPNSGAARTGTFTVGSKTFTVNQAAGCAVALVTDHGAADANGGSSSFNATTGAGCALTASTGETWIHNLATTSGSVTFTVDASGGGAGRSGNIVVTTPSTGASATYTLTQSAGCAIMLPVSAATTPVGGGSGTIAVTSGPGCTWSAAPGNAWVTNVAPTANGVTYSTLPNTGPARTDNVVVSSLQTASTGYFQVNQPSGCFVSLPTGTVSVGAGGGAGSFGVTFGASCAFTVSSSTSWLTGVQTTANGAQFTAAANGGVARTGAITVLSSDGTSTAVLTVDQAGTLAAPVITSGPLAPANAVPVGSSVTFDVTATGGGLSYQWTKNGVNITGATSASFTIPSVVAGDAGAYAVAISNSAGNATSPSVTLSIAVPDGGDAGASDGGTDAGADAASDAGAPGDGGPDASPSDSGTDATVTADSGAIVLTDSGTVVVGDASPDGGPPGDIGGGAGGCSVTAGNHASAAGDFALMALGVVALGAARKRRRG